MAKPTKLELTWIGKENRPRLEPRILIEDQVKSYHAPYRVKTGSRGDAENAEKRRKPGNGSAPPRLRVRHPSVTCSTTASSSETTCSRSKGSSRSSRARSSASTSTRRTTRALPSRTTMMGWSTRCGCR